MQSRKRLCLLEIQRKPNKYLGIKVKKFTFPLCQQAECCDCRGHVTEPLIRLFHIVSSGVLEEVTEAENSLKKKQIHLFRFHKSALKIPAGSASDAYIFVTPIISKFCVANCAWLDKSKGKSWSTKSPQKNAFVPHIVVWINRVDGEHACGKLLCAGAEVEQRREQPFCCLGKALPAAAGEVKQKSLCSVWRGMAAVGACETTAHWYFQSFMDCSVWGGKWIAG